jgi:hypothetical protein
VGLGGVFLVFTLRRWVARTRIPPSEPAPPSSGASPYSKILEKELKDFEA